MVADYLCQCETAADCDDKKPCTKDTCSGGKCSHTPVADGAKCSTANKCNVTNSGACKAGVCAGGQALDCSKALGPCQLGICDPAIGKCQTVAKVDGTKCDADKNGCTVADACLAGVCKAGAAADCSGKSKACHVGICQTDGANAFKCSSKLAAAGTACEDGQFCTVLDKCDAKGKCTAGFKRTCAEINDECNQGKCNETKEVCEAQPMKSTQACNDGAWCTVNDHCDGKGVCTGGGPKNCPDQGCKVGVCNDDKNACESKPAAKGLPCNDKDACTQADGCDASGKCAGTKKTCQGDGCNHGICQPATGACAKKPKASGTKCDDNKPCTEVDTCKSGTCTGSQTKPCSGDACNVGQCEKALGKCGLTPKPDETKCDDSEKCTGPDACLAGKCLGGGNTCVCDIAADCDDNNQCTSDACVSSSEGKACKNTITEGATCVDDKKCTTEDVCSSKGACLGTAINCLDGQACTTDFCVASTGKCDHKANTGMNCSDADKCTKNDKCQSNGKCLGSEVTCKDNQSCTSDACDGATGKCKFTALNSDGCNDGSSCTSSDACSGGKCVGKAVNCDDKNACTADSCDKTKGCKHSPTNEGKVCADTRLCLAGKCVCEYFSTVSGISPAAKESLNGITSTASGGAIAVGQRYKSGSKDQGMCQVVDLAGNVIASPTLSGSWTNDHLWTVVPMGGDTYFASGQLHVGSRDAGWVVKLGNKCNTIKSATFKVKNLSAQHYFRGLAADGSGGAWAVGAHKDITTKTLLGWLVHVDKDLKEIKQVDLPTIPLTKTHLQAIVRDDMGNFVAAGHRNFAAKAPSDGAAAMIDKDGKILWFKNYGTSAVDKFNAVAIEKNYIWLVGYTETDKANKGQDYWVVKLDAKGGSQLESRVHGQSGNDVLRGVAINGSTRIVVGSTNSYGAPDGAGHILRLWSNGTIDKKVIAGGSGDDAFKAVAFGSDGRVFASGSYNSSSAKPENRNPWVRSFSTSLEYKCK